VRWLLVPILAVAGVLIVRSFFLDVVDEVALRAAWAARGLFDLDADLLRTALKTEAGKKLAAGFAGGGAAGVGLAWAAGRRGGRRSRR
jgi:hypothetical protein